MKNSQDQISPERKIVKFGNAGRGQGTASSDTDLLILSRDSEPVRVSLASFRAKNKIDYPGTRAVAGFPGKRKSVFRKN